jgi:ABC-type transporter Mla subunit MlaD
MTRAKYLERRLTTCLEYAESTQEIVEKAIAQVRRMLKTIEDTETKLVYRRQLRELRRILRACKNEAAALVELIHRVRGEVPTQAKDHEPPPPLPTTIRVYVPKGVQIPEDVIKQLVLKTLNGYAKETDA